MDEKYLVQVLRHDDGQFIRVKREMCRKSGWAFSALPSMPNAPARFSVPTGHHAQMLRSRGRKLLLHIPLEA